MLKKYLNNNKTIQLEFTEHDLKISVLADVIEWDGLKHTITRFPEQLDTKLWCEQKVLTIDRKIALFCAAYKNYVLESTGKVISYTPMKKDINAMKSVPVTPGTIKAYFAANEWWCKQKNMPNYVHNINNIKLLIANAGSTKSKFPIEYDAKFERTLSGKELSDYWQHLNKIGWTCTTKAGRKIWKKSN